MESGILKVYKYINNILSFQKDIIGHFAGFNDFDWYPWMNESIPGSDLVLTSSKDLPIQLWNSSEGKNVSSWTPKDQLDQVANCLSVAFSPDGQNIICGGSNKIWLFNFNRPGDQVISQYLCEKKSKLGFGGLVSNLNFRFDNSGVFAASSFKGTIGIFDYRALENPLYVFNAHSNGVSQVKFLPDGWSLISAGRRDSSLMKWDLRMSSFKEPIIKYNLSDQNITSQRVFFDNTETKLFTGSAQNLIEFDIQTGEIISIIKFDDVVSSISSNNNGIAVSTGSREFNINFEDGFDTSKTKLKGLYLKI